MANTKAAPEQDAPLALEDQIKITHTPAVLGANFDVISKLLDERLEKYNNMVVSQDAIADARSCVADIRKTRKALDDKRKEVLRQIKEVASPFESAIMKLCGRCDDAAKQLTDQIAAFDEKLKAEIRETLQTRLNFEWKSRGIEDEFRHAHIDDLVTLGAVTPKGAITSKVSNEINRRIEADKALQDRTEIRLLKLENQSFKAGLLSPLRRNHVETFLFADDETYQAKLDHIIAAEIERQQETQNRTREQHTAELARFAANAPAESPANEAPPVAEPVTQSAPEHIEEPKPSPAGTVPITVTCSFHLNINPAITDSAVEAELRRMLGVAGFNSLGSVKVTRHQSAA